MDFVLSKNRKIMTCPECGKESPTKGNVTPTFGKKGSSGCKAYGTCPHCNYEGCVNRESYDNEPSFVK